jgi:predicted amidohydrolase YtcJ
MIDIVHFSVNRTTSGGRLLGVRERLSVQEALAAVTVNAAEQLGLAHRKGRIAVGLDADFVVLTRDPLSVPPSELRHTVAVHQTISRGQAVYQHSKM